VLLRDLPVELTAAIINSVALQKTPESTGLEPATSAVTGRRSNQLS
jgi:hypothetical protein